MKQAFLIGSIFLILLYVVRFLPVDFNTVTHPEAFISDDVLFIAKQYNLENKIERFRSSRLGITIRDMDYSAIARDLSFTAEQITTVDSLKANFKIFFSHPLVMEILGKEYTLALFPGEMQWFDVPIDTYVKENGLIIARPKHSARILELLSDIGASKASITESHYGGFTIKRIPVNDQETIAAVRIKNLLLLSYNERVIRKSINVFDGTIPNISETEDYIEATVHDKNPSFFSYLNVSQLLGFSKTVSTPQVSDVDSTPYFNTEALNGYRNVFWNIWSKKTSITHKTIINFDPSIINDKRIELLRILPEKTDTYKRISSESIWYYWTNVFQPEILYDLVVQREKDEGHEGDSRIGAEIEAATGYHPKDLLALIENDILFSLQSIPPQQFVPIPRFLAGIKLRDTEKGEQIIHNIINYYDIPVLSHEIEKVRVVSWGGVLAAGDLQPSIAIVDGYLLFSSNRQQIKDFVTFSHEGGSLADSALFKNVDTGISLENNSLNFIHFSKVTDLVKEIINWAGTMIAIQDRIAAQKSKTLLDLFCNPLLEGLSMYQAIGMRSYLDNTSIVLESEIKLEKGK